MWLYIGGPWNGHWLEKKKLLDSRGDNKSLCLRYEILRRSVLAKTLEQCQEDLAILYSHGMIALVTNPRSSATIDNLETIPEQKSDQHFEIARAISRMAQTAAAANY